jgi:hypothetical protein
MKNKTSLLVAVAILVASCSVNAQNTTTPPCPTGPICQLTPEQMAERQQQMQALMDDLREKRLAGIITDAENAWLDRMEQAGSQCVNGTTRSGCGIGQGKGLRNGTGPRSQAGTCTLIGKSTAAVAPAGQAVGKGKAVIGKRGAGVGLRDGTGPRSTDGTCPIVP